MEKYNQISLHLGRNIDKLSDHNKTTSHPTGIGAYVTQVTIGENGSLNFETISQNRILPKVLLHNSRKWFLVYA